MKILRDIEGYEELVVYTVVQGIRQVCDDRQFLNNLLDFGCVDDLPIRMSSFRSSTVESADIGNPLLEIRPFES